VALSLGHWLTDRTRVTAAAGVERWSGRANDVTLSSGIEHWRFGDRLRVSATLAQAIGADPFTTGSVAAAARTKAASDGVVLSGVAGYRAVSNASPLSVWPGADTGQARDVLLRAHPLLDNGIVTGGVFGRQLAFATMEAQRWRLLRRVPVRVAPAVFTDFARAWRGVDGGRTPLQIDAGVGLRVALPGAGTMRVDLARGLSDGHTALSAGWDVRWQ
jgi:hemolysin activation/secretion protein